MIDYNALNTEINTDQWKVIPAYTDKYPSSPPLIQTMFIRRMNFVTQSCL